MTADRGKREKSNLKDISIATGFSVNTISHALADKPDISASTKQLIQDKAAELGYVAIPPPAFSGLASAKPLPSFWATYPTPISPSWPRKSRIICKKRATPLSL
mgnify:CR=1 FL=1